MAVDAAHSNLSNFQNFVVVLALIVKFHIVKDSFPPNFLDK